MIIEASIAATYLVVWRTYQDDPILLSSARDNGLSDELDRLHALVTLRVSGVDDVLLTLKGQSDSADSARKIVQKLTDDLSTAMEADALFRVNVGRQVESLKGWFKGADEPLGMLKVLDLGKPKVVLPRRVPGVNLPTGPPWRLPFPSPDTRAFERSGILEPPGDDARSTADASQYEDFSSLAMALRHSGATHDDVQAVSDALDEVMNILGPPPDPTSGDIDVPTPRLPVGAA